MSQKEMTIQKQEITVPYNDEQIGAAVGVCLVIVIFCLLLGGILLPLDEAAAWIFWVSAALMMLLAAFFFGYMSMMLHLTPEQITVTLFGKVLRSYRVADIKLFCKLRFYQKVPLASICVSCYSMEELALLREEQLARGVFTRTELPFRKRAADWQRKFAHEWLLYGNQRQQRLQAKYFFLSLSPEIEALLLHTYPNIPMECFEEKYTLAEPGWHDRDPLAHCVGYVSQGSKIPAAVCAWIMLLLPCAVFGAFCFAQKLCLADILPALPLIVFWMTLWGLILFFGRDEYALLRHAPQGLSLTRGKRTQTIDRQEVRTIVSLKNCCGHSHTNLFISTLDVETLARKAVNSAYLGKTEKMLAQACKELPGCESFAILRYCRKALLARLQNPQELILIYRTKDRERTLRERYPDAVWIEYDIM